MSINKETLVSCEQKTAQFIDAHKKQFTKSPTQTRVKTKSTLHQSLNKILSKVPILAFLDILSTILATYLALLIRFDFHEIPASFFHAITNCLPFDCLIVIIVFSVFGLYSSTRRNVTASIFATLAISCLWIDVIFFTYRHILHLPSPRSFWFIFPSILLLLAFGIRSLFTIYENSKNDKNVHFHLKQRIYAMIKRIFGLLISIPLFTICLPLFFIISLLIKLDDHGPVIFKQLRTGKDGKDFYVFKFRTMQTDNDVLNFNKENQYTRIGRLLRATSLDELPQLINIIRGEMCFIGPRPWIVEYFKLMNEQQRHRVDVTPGLTGLAQAKGRNAITIFEKIDYDLEYIKHYSFKEDIMVIWLSIKTVLLQSGADASKSTIQNELGSLKEQSNQRDT